ncbi:PTS sugar transporter subunit IIB [Pectinatus cerevisiiphilus]|uniref:PTS system IIB component (L-Asc family) n=1 Tax=Pectinatus cerevisiiphilus TaxID=86956 RepID=A0A4R3KDU1_9FIRM|nr:PTS sugar transporter subunit IIB [Pectinatus cerevisiiphilus]TCS81466.1 PTS system IIB component (L-Asc family) [Pectinatus cerevisiiphilus]
MKFLCICQSGLGSSFMVQMNIQSILKAMNVKEEITVDHSDVGSTTPDLADYFFIEKTLGETVANLPKDRVILLNSLIDKNEIQAAITKILDKENIAHS